MAQAYGHAVEAIKALCKSHGSPDMRGASSPAPQTSAEGRAVGFQPQVSAPPSRSVSPQPGSASKGGGASRQDRTPGRKGGSNAQGIPEWDTAIDKRMRNPGRFQLVPGVQHPGGAGKPEDVLKEHEYILEEEWGETDEWIINPKSQWKEAWDLGVLFFILYSAIVVPFRICFSAEAEGLMWQFEVFVSIFFLIDVGFNFNCAYQVEDKIVISRRRIMVRYLSSASPAIN